MALHSAIEDPHIALDAHLQEAAFEGCDEDRQQWQAVTVPTDLAACLWLDLHALLLCAITFVQDAGYVSSFATRVVTGTQTHTQTHTHARAPGPFLAAAPSALDGLLFGDFSPCCASDARSMIQKRPIGAWCESLCV
eukprot:1147909-Pelagomonas_calceolata.AAC.4